MLRRARDWATGIGWVRIALGLVVAGLLVWGGYTVIYRLFLQPADLAREKGNRVVAEEQLNAEGKIADTTMNTIKERDVYREHVREIVTESRSEVDAAWTGETVGQDVDRIGAAALCQLHDSLCRAAPAEEVQ